MALDVVANECFVGWQGGGAFLNGAAIHVDATPESTFFIRREEEDPTGPWVAHDKQTEEQKGDAGSEQREKTQPANN